MAIDTRNKRASAVGCGLHFLRSLPAPDASVDALDRRQVVGLYRIEALTDIQYDIRRQHVWSSGAATHFCTRAGDRRGAVVVGGAVKSNIKE